MESNDCLRPEGTGNIKRARNRNKTIVTYANYLGNIISVLYEISTKTVARVSDRNNLIIYLLFNEKTLVRLYFYDIRTNGENWN